MHSLMNKRMQSTISYIALFALVILVSSCFTHNSSSLTVNAADISNLAFSNELSQYQPHLTARSRTVEQIYDRTATPGITLESGYAEKRKEIIRMYQSVGIDISLDKDELRKLKPQNWSKQTPQPLDGSYPQPYSIDAPFYHEIPTNFPRVLLPAGYVQSGHISTLGSSGDGSDEFGIGVVIGSASDPIRTIHLEQANQYAKIGTCPQLNPWTRLNVKWHIPDSANTKLGSTGNGVPRNQSDRAVVWLDRATNKTVATWGTIENCQPLLGDWSAMHIQQPDQLPSLGDAGGINAANKSDIVTLIRPGEAINPQQPIPHALSGPVRNAWKAIVYPASNYDQSIHQNNRGLLGYGFLVQLDPNLNLASLNLSLPARRILEAIQTYGWYMDDTGVRDFDIKGNFSAAEFAPYGGVNVVDAQVLSVLKNQKLYVVPPLVKR